MKRYQGMKAAGIVAALGMGGLAGLPAAAAELSFAHFAAPSHPVAKWIEGWTKEVAGQTGGEVSFNILPGAQLGPITKYYDIARRGQADVTWILHGGTPGRFPLTELSNLPFMFCSGEHATKVLNDSGLRRDHLDAEHRGVKVLQIHAHVPGHVWMHGKPIRTVADFKGAAIRPASRTIGAFVQALGATPVGMPPNALAENMQKGVIAGTFMDYVAGAFAFKLGPVTKYLTEMHSYTASLAFVMNQASWNKLSAKSKGVFTATMRGREKDVGGAWDKLNFVAREALVKGGTEIVKMAPADFAELKAVGDRVVNEWAADIDKKGKPGTAVLNQMRDLAKKTRAGSTDFCS
jgi:TRAP-type C4-dicarboxylate transport system substrate-binding protein